MKTKVATILLAAAFLSAGAFASGKPTARPHAFSSLNQTVIAKNQNWPIKEMMTVEPCAVARCFNI
jgi:hypothetical protein